MDSDICVCLKELAIFDCRIGFYVNNCVYIVSWKRLETSNWVNNLEQCVRTFFTLLIITRSHELGFGRNLVEIDRRSLPQLSKQLRDLDNSPKHKTKLKFKISKIRNNLFSSFLDPTVRFQTSGSGYREIWTRRIRICGQKLQIISIRAEKVNFIFMCFYCFSLFFIIFFTFVLLSLGSN